MASNTTSYGLNQWTKTDVPLMDDHNRDNQRANTAIGNLDAGIGTNQQELSKINGYFSGGKAKQAIYAEKADVAQNGVGNYTFQLKLADWRESMEFMSHPFEAKISIPQVVSSDDAMIFFDMHSVVSARDAGIIEGLGRTVNGGIQLYAEKIPDRAFDGCCVIIHKEG